MVSASSIAWSLSPVNFDYRKRLRINDKRIVCMDRQILCGLLPTSTPATDSPPSRGEYSGLLPVEALSSDMASQLVQAFLDRSCTCRSGGCRGEGVSGESLRYQRGPPAGWLVGRCLKQTVRDAVPPIIGTLLVANGPKVSNLCC